MTAPDDTSLLAHLAYKFGGGETVATEALGYILGRSRAAREALRDMLKVGGADVGPLERVETRDASNVDGRRGVGPLERVETEVVGKKRDRIDLAAYDEADAERVLVEVKFGADLSDNQPAEYLRRLPVDGNVSVLLFVAPESRLETLWPEIRDMAKRGGFALNDVSETGRLRAAAVAGGNRRLMLTSWRLLLEAMRSRAAADDDSSAEQDLRQLNGLCEQEDAAVFRPLLETEIGPEFPSHRMPDFRRLVDDATELLVQEGRAETQGLKATPLTTGYGRYLRIGRKEAWLGVSQELWAQKGKEQTSIWIQFDDDTFPLRLRTGVDYGEVLKDLVNQLRDRADLLAPASEAS